jgi:hypothetical protein
MKVEWFPYSLLEKAKVSNSLISGVYIIWHGGQKPRVVRLGSGNIAERLSAHSNDKAILAYQQFGSLWVTWAIVSASLQPGVERWLADNYPPLVGDRFPDARPIEVNSPFAA